MAVNFGILDPDMPAKLAGSVYAGQQERQQNELAQQQAQMRQQLGTQQLETGRLQQQQSQMQMDQMIRDRDALAKLQQAFVANGKSPDLEANFDEMIRSGIQHFVDIGIKGKQKILEQKQFADIMGDGAAAPANALAPAQPAPGAVPIRQGLTPGTSVTTFDGSGTPTNALAPAPAQAPAAAQTNALAPKSDVAAMRSKRDRLLAMGTTQSIAAAKALDADIALASKEPVYHNVPGVGLVDPRTGKTVVAAKEQSTPTNLARLQTEMNALPPGDPRRAAYEAAIAKESQFAPNAPTNLARLQTEFAALPPNDPRRKQYLDLIRKETTHAPAVNITNVQEKAEAGEFGKLLVGQYSDISKAAGLAVKTLPSIEANLGALNKGLDTGFGTDAKAAGARVLGALGVKDADKYATDTQTFQSNAISAVLQKQLEQKGPQTESDARRIEQVGAELGKTKAANEFILSTAKEQLRRDIEQRNFYDKWKEQTGSFKGAESAWFAGEGNKSLFDRPALKKFATGTTSTVGQIPTAATPSRATPAPATTAITNPKFPGFSIGKP